MSEIDDALDFINESEKNQKINDNPDSASLGDLLNQIKSSESKVKPGQPTQYELYGDGYMPSSQTVDKLPTGSYHINVSNTGVFVTPSLKQDNLLLDLPEMKSDAVLKVIDRFWGSEDDYKLGNEFVVGGAPYKGGVLIYGPPGSGKSCTIKIATNKMVERGGVVFYGSNPVYLADFLVKFAKIEPNRKSVVVFEDIDSLVENYGEAGYLDLLDSANSINNVFFIATTNYPERLDPRIYNRPGRFSHVIKIGLPSAVTRTAYLKAILKNHKDVEYIVDNSDGFTIDHLTALTNAVYREKKDLESEIKRLRSLFKIPTVSNKQVGIAQDELGE